MIFPVDPGVWLVGLRINTQQRWVGLFLGKWVLVLWGSGEGKKTEASEQRVAAIRSEARQRCIQELIAFSRGDKIEGGLGIDIQRAYILSNVTAIWKETDETLLD